MSIIWKEISETNELSSSLWKLAMQLYDASFPPEVREEYAVFVRSIEESKNIYPSNFHFLLACDEKGQIAGFVTAHYLSSVNFGFVVYIVVNPLLQGQGIGSNLLEQIQFLLEQDARYAHQANLRGIILEAERIEDAHTDEESGSCIRRNSFFEKNGYLLMHHVSYLQPPLQPPNAAFVPLQLLVKTLGRRDTVGEEVDVAVAGAVSECEIRDVVNAMYREKYGRMNQISQNVLRECEGRLQFSPKTSNK